MTSHERWIIYPILFLTLGIAMRDKVIPPRTTARRLEADLVRCNRLEVGQAECGVIAVSRRNGTEGIRLGMLPGRGGQIEIRSAQGKTVIIAGTDQAGKSGLIETLDANGTPQVQLLSTPAGGAVTTVRHDKKMWVVTGHAGENFGVFAGVPNLGRQLPLTWPWRIEMKPADTKPNEESRKDSADEPTGSEKRKGNEQ